MELDENLSSQGFPQQKNHNDFDSSHLDHEVTTTPKISVRLNFSLVFVDLHFTYWIYMCLVWHGGQLGLAYYDANCLEIHLLSDVLETDTFSLIKQAVHQIQPLVIVLNSTHDSRLLSCLKEIDYEVSKRRILMIKLPSIPHHFSDGERQLYFQSLISWKSTNMVRSVGGLLKYLEERRVGFELEADADQVPVLGFKTFTLESQIQMDCLTYSALNIFGVEQHPSVFKSGWRSSKESLSLFGILNRCKSTIGSHRLRDWFLKPLKDAGKIKQRYDAISFLMSPQNIEAVSCLEGCLKHIKFLPKVLLRMSKAQATIGDWVALYKTLYHAVYVKNICKTLSRSVDIFVQITNSFTDDLHKCMTRIQKTIDFEESKERKRFTVQANVDPDLDEKKRSFNGLPDLMTHVAREEIESLNSEIQNCIVSCLPEIGYLLVLNMPEGKTSRDDHTIEGLEFKFASSCQLFYKSPKTKELDNIIGDTQSDILEIEFLIMHDLQSTILESTQVIMDVMNLTADLDWYAKKMSDLVRLQKSMLELSDIVGRLKADKMDGLNYFMKIFWHPLLYPASSFLALARCASEFGYVRPNLIEEKTIEIKQGRHPLQELCCNPFVSNNTNLGGQFHKMKLITGPNACGKSVYLKQVALVIFMAHIGSFVPAEEASIGPVDAIFSRIKSTESVSVQMSTFMQDISQVCEALRSATASSLVILDEFGKGSKSEDGLSLLTAVLKFWIAKGHARPFTLVSTHFHSIIQQKLLPQGETENLTFDTFCNSNELIFLYQLLPGHTSSSFACSMATQMGMPSKVVQRGHQVSKLLCQYKVVPIEEDCSSIKQRKLHEKTVDSFLSLDLKTGDTKKYLASCISNLDCDKSQHRPSKQTHDFGLPPRVLQLSDKSVYTVEDEITYKDNHKQSEIETETNCIQKCHDHSRAINCPTNNLSSLTGDSAEWNKSPHFPDAKNQRKKADQDNVIMETNELTHMENASCVKPLQEKFVTDSFHACTNKEIIQMKVDDQGLFKASTILLSSQFSSKDFTSSESNHNAFQTTAPIQCMQIKCNSDRVDCHGEIHNTSSTSFEYAKDYSTSSSKIKSTLNSTSSLKSSYSENQAH